MSDALRVDFTPGEDDHYLEDIDTGDEALEADGDDGDLTADPEDGSDEDESVGGDGEDDGDSDSAEDDDEGLILGKFKSTEDLAKAYQELQKQFSKGRQGKEDSLRLGDPGSSRDSDIDSEDTPVDFSLVDRDISKSGEVSEETYKALAKAKIPRAAVDRYVRGIQAEVQTIQSAMTEIAGGEDELKQVLDYARQNLSQEEKAHFDSVLDTGNLPAIKLMMGGVMSRFQAESDGSPNLVRDGKTARKSKGVKPFGSLDELADAMDDPRYESNAAYRKQVDRRLRASKL